MSKRHPAPNWTTVRMDLWTRGRGRCEGCGKHLGNEGAVHHRRLRSQGGGHDYGNLLLLHPTCHTHAHANPAWAMRHGWIVSGWGLAPDLIPVVRCDPTRCLHPATDTAKDS